MGFFNRNKKKQIVPNSVYKWWETAPVKETVDVPDGVERNCFYLYRKAPLKGMRKGTIITVSAVPGDVLLLSDDGDTLDTATTDVIAYAYQGQIIGMSSFAYDVIKQMLLDGYRLNITAKIITDNGYRTLAFLTTNEIYNGIDGIKGQ